MLSFGAPAFLFALGLLPVIVLLHFIRSRRVRRQVAGLFLWRRAQQAAQRQRRFAPTLLLLAQLLFASLAAVALAQPRWGASAAPDRILILDASASMNADDGPGQGVRFANAKREAAELLSGAGRVAIVRAGLDARVVAPLSSDRNLLRDALADLRAGDRSADLDRAIDVADAIEPTAEIHLLTDQPPAGGTTIYHGMAGSGINVGISTFDLGIQQAYVGVVSNSTRPVQVALDLSNAGEPVASSTVLVPAGGIGSLTFPLSSVAGVYRARITPPAGDALALDDIAYAGSKVITAALDRPNEAVVKALAALPGVELRTGAAAATAAADLHVLFRASSEGLAPGAYVLFAPPAVSPVFATVQRWDRADPLLRFVDLGDVVVGLDPDAPAWQQETGWRTLASTGDLRPVLRSKDEDGVQVLQAAFAPDQSDLVLRPAFPALMANFVREVRGDTTVVLGQSLPPDARYLGAGDDGSGAGEGTAAAYALEPGLYDVGGVVFLANLASEAESRLPGPVSDPQTQASQRPAASSAPAATGASFRSLGLVLVACALAALVVEWLLWSGGVGRLPAFVRRRGGRGRA